MNKCPRCENEKLKDDYNYCPICGALTEIDMAKEAVKILNTLIDNYKTYECEDTEEEKYRALVVGALSIAINQLEKTAQEVPVQEQYVTLKIDSKEIAKVIINEINKQQKSAEIQLIV